MRAWLKHGWKVGAFWINYESPPIWGKAHANDSTMPVAKSNQKNRVLLGSRYHEYLSSGVKHTEDIIINDNEIDYISHPQLPSLPQRLISYATCHTVGDIYKFLRYVFSK